MPTRRGFLAAGAALGTSVLAGCSAISGAQSFDAGPYRTWVPHPPAGDGDRPAITAGYSDYKVVRKARERVDTTVEPVYNPPVSDLDFADAHWGMAVFGTRPPAIGRGRVLRIDYDRDATIETLTGGDYERAGDREGFALLTGADPHVALGEEHVVSGPPTDGETVSTGVTRLIDAQAGAIERAVDAQEALATALDELPAGPVRLDVDADPDGTAEDTDSALRANADAAVPDGDIVELLSPYVFASADALPTDARLEEWRRTFGEVSPWPADDIEVAVDGRMVTFTASTDARSYWEAARGRDPLV